MTINDVHNKVTINSDQSQDATLSSSSSTWDGKDVSSNPVDTETTNKSTSVFEKAKGIFNEAWKHKFKILLAALGLAAIGGTGAGLVALFSKKTGQKALEDKSSEGRVNTSEGEETKADDEVAGRSLPINVEQDMVIDENDVIDILEEKEEVDEKDIPKTVNEQEINDFELAQMIALHDLVDEYSAAEKAEETVTPETDAEQEMKDFEVAQMIALNDLVDEYATAEKDVEQPVQTPERKPVESRYEAVRKEVKAKKQLKREHKIAKKARKLESKQAEQSTKKGSSQKGAKRVLKKI